MEALTLNHYDLAEVTGISHEIWKRFLSHPEVSEYVRTESNLIQQSELNKMVQGISKSHSVGQAQIMNTLSKLNEVKPTKEGPVFIYTYVPLNENEQKAPNVTTEAKDIFLK